MSRIITIDNGTEDVKFTLDTGEIEPESKATIILRKDFDINEARDAFKDFYAKNDPNDENKRLFYHTEPHIGSMDKMGLFGDYAPSVVYSSNRYHNTHLPFRESNMTEFGYSKLCHLYCTIDKS